MEETPAARQADDRPAQVRREKNRVSLKNNMALSPLWTKQRATYRFPHGNLNISRPADVAAKRRESTENHVFRLTILRREKFPFQCG
jgi:hypothetical protein